MGQRYIRALNDIYIIQQWKEHQLSNVNAFLSISRVDESSISIPPDLSVL